MNKMMWAVFVALALVGCAAEKFKVDQERANLVKDGMTPREVIEIVGDKPTSASSSQMLWTRGKFRTWNGTSNGAIRFLLKNGKTYGIPLDGIISPGGVALYIQEQSDLARTQAARQKARDDALEAEKAEVAREIQAEYVAIKDSRLTCASKQECTKMFALAQVYVSENANQKIQVATDTIIETYNPTISMNIGMRVVKIPQHAALEDLVVTVICHDDYDVRACRQKRTLIYSQFRPFVESSMSK